jgi:uncharacterized protein YdaU (DUF1376 family)
MHYYQFNIGDYHSHTNHLEPLEDLAYRRMIDIYYLNEIPLPKDVEEIARLIRMRTHTDCIAVVLRDFFELTKNGYIQARIDTELAAFRIKSEKARKSAKARWDKTPSKSKPLADANALQTECEGNAIQEPLHKKQEPLTKGNRANKFAVPTQKEIGLYFLERGSGDSMNQADKFYDFYSSKAWMIGKNKMKDWKAAVRNWIRSDNEKHQRLTQPTAKQAVNDALTGADANNW